MRLSILLPILAIASVLTFAAIAQDNGAPAPLPAEPKAALRAIKDTNDALLKQQEALLERLDELDKNASQLRIFTRRS